MKNLLLFFFLSLLIPSFATEKGYDLIEDKATIPFSNPTLLERKVAKIRLHNGLEAYLISDPKTEESGAALCVEVGSWHDPEEYPGTAHFLEHMLFMGTKAFPDEREYWQYIQDNGGKANAYTASDHTAYLFSIKNNAFEGAFLRFSHFFVDPLLATSSIDRELHAVDQEHAKNIEDDAWREWMIFKETGNPRHPNVKFSTGNAKTLSDIPQEVLKKWVESHYSAKVMHLIVLSPLPIDKLIALTVENFSKAPSFIPQKKEIDLPITSPKQRGHFTYIHPVKDLRQLVLSWEIPSSFVCDLESHCPEIISYALSHGGKKGLSQKLKDENLAENLNIEIDRLGKKELLFQIRIDLSHQGLSQIDAVIERCFQAISRLKTSGIPPTLFQEMQTQRTLNYQYQSRQNAFCFVMQNSFLIVYEPLETFPEKTFIPTAYNPATLSAFIEHLTPQNALFYLQADSSLTSIPTDTKEKWMGAEYTIREIPKTKLLSWQEINPSSDLQLPDTNPYIPEHFEIKKHSPNTPTPEKPHLLFNQEDAKIYYAADTHYLVPEVGFLFSFKSPLIDGSAKQQMLLDLFLIALSDCTSSQAFFAKQAGTNFSFSSKDLSLRLVLCGFHDKAPLLLKQLVKEAKTIAPTSSQFTRYKEKLITRYENQAKTLPLQQASESVFSLLTNYCPTAEEKLRSLNHVTYEEFSLYANELLEKVFIEGTLYGNLSQSEASHLWNELKTVIDAKPYPVAEQTKKEVLSFPFKQGPFMLKQTTDRQGHGVFLVIDEAPFSFENRAAETVLASALREAFFDTLRTKQQTAYIAQAWSQDIERHLFQSFAVQSSTHTPQELLARFELFFEEFLRDFDKTLSKERFETIRSSRIASLEMKPENLRAMTSLLHHLAFEYDGFFDLKKKRIEALQNLSYETLHAFAKRVLARSNTKRLAVLMEGAPATDHPFRYETTTKEALHEKGTYVAWK